MSFGMQLYTSAGTLSSEFTKSVTLISGPHFWWNLPQSGSIWVPDYNRYSNLLYLHGVNSRTPFYWLQDTNRVNFDFGYFSINYGLNIVAYVFERAW